MLMWLVIRQMRADAKRNLRPAGVPDAERGRHDSATVILETFNLWLSSKRFRNPGAETIVNNSADHPSNYGKKYVNPAKS